MRIHVKVTHCGSTGLQHWLIRVATIFVKWPRRDDESWVPAGTVGENPAWQAAASGSRTSQTLAGSPGATSRENASRARCALNFPSLPSAQSRHCCFEPCCRLHIRRDIWPATTSTSHGSTTHCGRAVHVGQLELAAGARARWRPRRVAHRAPQPSRRMELRRRRQLSPRAVHASVQDPMAADAFCLPLMGPCVQLCHASWCREELPSLEWDNCCMPELTNYSPPFKRTRTPPA